MSGNIFDGCVAKDVGLDCECRYCSFIKQGGFVEFPEGFPQWMKDYRALKELQQEDKVKEHDGRLNNQFTRIEAAEKLAKKVDDDHAKSIPVLDALNTETRNTISPRVAGLDNRTKDLDNQIIVNTQDIATLKNQVKANSDNLSALMSLNILNRLTDLEKKVR